MLEAEAGRSEAPLALALDAAYWDHYLNAMVLDPGCREALTAWREAGLRLAWVTDMVTAQQLRKLVALGLTDAADFVVTSEEAGAEKPQPAAVDLALFKLGVPANDAWLIGDSRPRDVGAARARGLRAVWFRRGPDEEAGPAPDHTVDDWFALRVLVEQALRG
jgi:putative hydrolase of the HAD superfamily